MTRYALAPLAVLALGLAGCISFGATPPDTLLTLTSVAQPPVGRQQDSAGSRSLVVNVPVSPAALAASRIPVQTTPTSIAYVKDAQWSEPPTRLFARLMSDTVSARTGRVVISAAQAVGEANDQLDGELRRFGIDGQTREAVVTFDAALTHDGSDGVRERRFEARVPMTVIDAASVGPALNQAANQVASEVADWIGRG